MLGGLIPKSDNNDVKGRRNHLTPTALSQYVGLDSCDRYLRFYLYRAETERLTKQLANQAGWRNTAWRPVQTLSPLLTDIGERIEREVLEMLEAQGHIIQDLAQLDAAAALKVLAQTSDATARYFYQVPMAGKLGRWPFEGRADLVQVRRGARGLEFLVIDIKASRKDKVQHRLQIAVYVLLLQQMLADVDIVQAKFAGAIVRRAASSHQSPAANQPLATTDSKAVAIESEKLQTDSSTLPTIDFFPFELEPYLDTVRHLTVGENSPLERVDAASDLNQLHYYLGPRCDGCAFGPVCLSESAARQDLSLIPYLESSDKRLLKQAGITNLSQLAALKQFVTESSPPDSEGKPSRSKTRLEVAPAYVQTVEKLSHLWPLAPRLDRLIQRAAVNLRHFDRTTPARRYFVDKTGGSPRRGRSNLPDDKLYPDLIKIFIDVQTDYLEEKLYLAGALITTGEAQAVAQTVVRMTKDVPNADAERDLLLEWVGAIYVAVTQVAAKINPNYATDGIRLHLYLYNRRDQKILLDALRHHLDAFANLPAFYHLLTDTPALSQPALAFLYDEVRERLNLSGPLASLVAVSRQLGYKWQDTQGQNWAKIFRAGVFDYSSRRSDGVWVQTAARFYSGIPLEYAYAAWKRLPSDTSQYAGVSAKQIQAFAAQRLYALAHIEASFSYKNSYLHKEPLQLLPTVVTASNAPDLAQILEEFLLIEQYTQLQQHLELFARPIVRRMEEGRALLGRCTEIETTPLTRRRKQLHATFLVELDRLNIYSQTAIQVSKLKEGDFVTVSPFEDDAQPWKIVGGRLARIAEISGGWLKLELSGSTLGQGQSSAFRYFHARDLLPQPGQLYTIDPMVDNLNGDKLLEACRHATHNTLYEYAIRPKPQQSVTKPYSPALAYFLDIVKNLEKAQGREPTLDQLEVIGGHLDDALLLVQGPPGTGKSHTLGWAVLARIFMALAQDSGQNMRVLVSSQTHNAVEIVLASVAQKWQQLVAYVRTLDTTPTQPSAKDLYKALQALTHLKIFKAGGDENKTLAEEVIFLDPWYREQVLAVLNGQDFVPDQPKVKAKKSSAKTRVKVVAEPPLPPPHLLVIGATPGNLYNLMKEYYGRGKTKQNTVWDETANKYFDLLVLDEASQMNLPHALLAAGWLKPSSPVVVVGDHRQLSPILAHGWEHEEHLPTVSARPYRSVFQYFLDNGWARVALSESFRLHSTQAAFLATHIYKQDGVSFHSHRQKLLPSLPAPLGPSNANLEKYLAAVLHPDYPVIVLEHSEAASLQYNQVELDLISPLIAAATTRLSLDGATGIGIVVPHRAQKAALHERFPLLGKAGAIDTVERFQGAERDLIIVSTTASDPDYVASEAEFLLSPNRFNVALSRPRAKLIVVASSSIFEFVSAHLELFEQALLWKQLAAAAHHQSLWNGQMTDILPTKSDLHNKIKLKVYGF